MSTNAASLETTIRRYQQKVFREYNGSIGLPNPYTYPDGNPVRPLPPVQTAIGGLMIVGAYPSARFEARPSVSDPRKNRLVPIADNLHPFARELYFDGRQARVLESGEGLRRHLLDPIGISAEACWITDLVKVFLYKEDHRDSCGDAVPHFSVPVLRRQFIELGRKSLPWLLRECEICRPRIVITLGEEVARVVSGDVSTATFDLLTRPARPVEQLAGVMAIHLPHPDACRRSPKWAEVIQRRICEIRGEAC